MWKTTPRPTILAELVGYVIHFFPDKEPQQDQTKKNFWRVQAEAVKPDGSERKLVEIALIGKHIQQILDLEPQAQNQYAVYKEENTDYYSIGYLDQKSGAVLKGK